MERVAVSHLFATGERNSDGFIVRSIKIHRDEGGEQEEREKERERVAC